MSETKRILMVVTNHSTLTADHKTGLWLEEFAVPYNTFRNQGYEVKVTSIEGGDIPLDPNSLSEESHPEWSEAEGKLKNTAKLTTDDAENFDAVFMPGGHGTMFDFPNNTTLQNILQRFAESNRVIAAVCHGPSGLVNATYENGTPLVEGKKVSAFTDKEEQEMQLVDAMPFLLESTLREKGAEIVSGDNWADVSVRDGNLVTGQNPQSSGSTAEKVIQALEEA